MAITGAVGAFLRRNDPYPDWTFVHDYTGLGPNNPGRPVYKNNGIIYNRPDYDPNFSFTRSGADLIYFNPVENIWKAVEANKTGIDSSGFQIHESTTNKCSNYNAAPTDLTGVTKSGDAAATLTVVDDTAALRAAGFGSLIDAGKMNGKVYRLDNSAGSTQAFAAFSGNTGNTSGHWGSCFARGSGTIILTGAGAGFGGNVTFAGTPSYVRYGFAFTSGGASNFMRFSVNPGSIVYFILNQLEEKAYATNPVIVAGAAATRGAPAPVVTGLASLLTPPFTLVVVANLSAIDGVNRPIIRAGDGTVSNFLGYTRVSGNSLSTEITTSGVSQPSVQSRSGYTGPRLIKMAARVRATSAKSAIDNVLGGEIGISVPVTDRLFIGANAILSAFVNSPILFVGIAPNLSDTQLQAITASNNLYMDFQ